MATKLQSSAPLTTALVSLCDYRARTIDGERTGTDDADAPLAQIVRVIGHEVAADGVLVAWHTFDREPAFLFASGACEPNSEAERDMLISARETAGVDRLGTLYVRPVAGDGEAGTVLSTRVEADGGVITITHFFRMIRGAAQARARETTNRLLPMIEPFFRLWSLRAKALARAESLAAAVNSSGTGTLLVNRHGQVVFANAVAEQLMLLGDGVRRAGTMLSATKLADTMRLQASIEHVANGFGESGNGPVVALHRKVGRPLLAVVIRHDGDGSIDDVAAIVHLFDPERDVDTLLAPVTRLYGLSPVESRLAGLLAKGQSLTDTAAAMRIQEQTARSYLKRIFLKTDTNRQAELVGMLLKSAVETAPACRTSFI